MFGCLLDLKSINNPKGPLTCKQTFLPIAFSGIELIPITTITPTTYLGSWAFVILIIATRFMNDQCPFLLEALAKIDNNTFPF
jgi:hypothetical protein